MLRLMSDATRTRSISRREAASPASARRVSIVPSAAAIAASRSTAPARWSAVHRSAKVSGWLDGRPASDWISEWSHPVRDGSGGSSRDLAAVIPEQKPNPSARAARGLRIRNTQSKGTSKAAIRISPTITTPSHWTTPEGPCRRPTA
jgi:hypothetical protein